MSHADDWPDEMGRQESELHAALSSLVPGMPRRRPRAGCSLSDELAALLHDVRQVRDEVRALRARLDAPRVLRGGVEMGNARALGVTSHKVAILGCRRRIGPLWGRRS